MKTSQFVLILAGAIFISTTLVSIESEIIKSRQELILVKDAVNALYSQAEKVPIRQQTQTGKKVDETQAQEKAI